MSYFATWAMLVTSMLLSQFLSILNMSRVELFAAFYWSAVALL